MKYDLIAFDYDGTLVDTIAFHTVTIGKIMRDCGVVMDDDAVKQELGGTLKHIFGQVLPLDRVDDAIVKLRAFYEKIPSVYWDYVTVIKDVPETIKKLRDKGCKTALITNSHFRLVEQSLIHFGLDKSFDLVLGDDEICKNKQERFDKMFDFFNISRDHILYVGDSNGDVKDAHAKGIKAAILDTEAAWFHQIRPRSVEELGADYVFPSIRCLTEL